MIETTNTITPSIVKEVGNSTSVNDNNICSNKGNRKNKCSGKKSGVETRDRIAEKRLICYRYR